MKKIVACLMLALFCLSLVACSYSSKNKNSNESEISIESSIDEVYTDDFVQDIYDILQHHIDVKDGTITKAEYTGAMFAYELNLKMYESSRGATSLYYRIYYRAVYGIDKYTEEYGYNQEYLDDVYDYFGGSLKPEAEPETPSSSALQESDEYVVEFISSHVIYNYDDAPVLVVEYAFTNNTDKTMSFTYTIDDQVFQNGIECDSALVYTENKPSEKSLDVKPGFTHTFKVEYNLNDEMSDVEIECYKMFDFSSNPEPLLQHTIKMTGD